MPTTARTVRKNRPANAAGSSRNETWEGFKSVVVAVLLFVLIRTFVVQAFSIPSGSMEETLEVGDYLMANNAVFGARLPFTETALPGLRDPRRGEIVVFRPEYNQPVIDVVKRVIGVPGDTLQMRDGAVTLNGRPLEEPYVRDVGMPDEPLAYQNPGAREWHLRALAPGAGRGDYEPTRESWGPLVVPEGHYFLMGDNRDQSLDSRYMGFIPREVIHGKPLFLYFSVDRNTGESLPFITAVRWGRVGDVIR